MQQIKDQLLQLKENIETSASSADWVACSRCGVEYRHKVMSRGLCYRCAEQPEREYRAAIEQARRDENVRRRIEADLGGPKAAREFTLEAFRAEAGTQRAFDAACAFDPSSQNLYLWGPCGVGKTHLAVVAARAALDGVQVLKSYELLRLTRGKDAAGERAVIDELVALNVFVLDDLGVEKSTEYALQILYEVIDRRDMADRHGLVVTSNLPLDVLAEKLGDDRLPSRLAGLCRVIELAGDDWRQRKAAR